MEPIMPTNQECQPQECNPCEMPKEMFSLWGIAYHITDPAGIYFSGNAVVLARDARQAETIFRTNSAFNGIAYLLMIEAIAQIPTLSESGLCVESYTDGVKRKINYGH